MAETDRESRSIKPVTGVRPAAGESGMPTPLRGADKPAEGAAPSAQHAVEVARPDLRHVLEGLTTHQNIGLTYVIDQETRSVTIKVIDRDTNQVVREIPSEEMTKLRAAMRDLYGLLLKTQA